MRVKQAIFIIILGGYAWFIFTALHPPLPTEKRPLIFYSNQIGSDLKRVILHAIGRAERSVAVQIYSLTDPDVIASLGKAAKRGVQITLYYDPKASKTLPFGYPVKTSGLMHRKILVVDGKFTLIGSANFTTQSLKMHSNVLVGLYSEEAADHFSKAVEDEAIISISDCQLKSYFLPDFEGRALDTLCKTIREAKESIELAMFTLTHPRIIDELSLAVGRGLSLQVAIDPYTLKGSSKQAIAKLKSAGATILSSHGKQLLHHKWALIDKKIFVMGSANWTKAAFSNNQDCLLIFESLSKAHRKKLSKLWRAVAITSEKK